MKHSLKVIVIVISILLTNFTIAQTTVLKFDFHDVKVISEHTNDTIDRDQLFLNKDETLKKLGDNFLFKYVDYGMWGPYNSYKFDKDHFAYRIEKEGNTYASFTLQTSKFKILIENKYLLQVGKNIEECLNDYKPVTYRETERKAATLIIKYTIDEDYMYWVKDSYLVIVFDKTSKIITKIVDQRRM